MNSILDYEFISILILITILFTLIWRRISQKNDLRFNKTSLPSNINFYGCPDMQSENHQNEPRPLVVITSWLGAHHKYIDKYRQIWHKRKFDVLVVKLKAIDVLLPPIGAQIIVKNTVKVLSNLMTEYSDIVFHNFSGGVYIFGQVIVHLSESQSSKNSILRRKIKGAINDSVVPPILFAQGMSHSITTGPIKLLILKKTLYIFSSLFRIFTARKYEQGMYLSRSWDGQVLYFYSKTDEILDYKIVEKFIKTVRESGIRVTEKCWEDSAHVQHYRTYPKEYEQELDDFLNKLKIHSNNNN